ncbi:MULTISPECIES: spore coat protein GerQ [Bacillaceae]|uniref:Spore coat protein GerQ n=1 Tax=Evansella alkalicola TaxID=745819 RepID=A0ABS6K0B7_9BACI|nr:MULTISPECIES: spore coat protein GerQ [Bacillaceae]MBU9724296.1 spore coat protein GerQ [Bacillus alkalicola]
MYPQQGQQGYPGYAYPGTGAQAGGLPGQQMPAPPGYYQQYLQAQQAQIAQAPGQLPIEQSYIENILRLNRGKVGTFYMTFEYNERWNAKVFKGVIEAAGRDHIIISDPQTGKRYLLLMVNLDYVTFDEELKYDAAFGGEQAELDTFSPR